MRRFLKNTKGAVTVFVTILLIPSLIISGTSVDLARMHTARSTVQNANQLAANTILTQYNAMLKDIYGLFAIMESDPILGDMLAHYINVTILGEDFHDRAWGSFQLFHGSVVQPAAISFPDGQHLSNSEVLRRQIEEYMKYRAPVIIMQELMSILNSLDRLSDDAAVIDKNIEISEKIEELEDAYEQIFETIENINSFATHLQNAFTDVNAILERIHEELKRMEGTRNAWRLLENLADEGDRRAIYQREDYARRYAWHRDNIRALVQGGTILTNWRAGSFDNNNEWVQGRYETTADAIGLNNVISAATGIPGQIDSYLDQLVRRTQRANDRRVELNQLVDELETKLAGNVSQELRDGFTSPVGQHNNMSIIDQYRNLLSWNIVEMAEQVRDTNRGRITTINNTLNGVGFGRVVNGTVLTDPQRTRVQLLEIDISTGQFALDAVPGAQNLLTQLANPNLTFRYSVPDPNNVGFLLFQEHSDAHRGFFNALEDMFRDAAGGRTSRRNRNDSRNSIRSLAGEAQRLFQGWSMVPDGARWYRNESGEVSTGFGYDGNWGSGNQARNRTRNALNNNVLTGIGNIIGDAADHLLLVTYASEMFSNFATSRPNGDIEFSLTGVPFGIEVNYFFQSEHEFLIHGNRHSATANLAAVSGLLLLTRFVFNYIASFSVPEVKAMVASVKAATAFLGPFAIAIAELARVGIALAESALDVAALRNGERVPLLKTSETWRFSVSGIMSGGSVADMSGRLGTSQPSERNRPGDLSYKDYMRLFMILQSPNDLADRISFLIGTNMTNVLYVSANTRDEMENAMRTATRFNMAHARTGFEISTTVDMRMLFLSMPFAQNRADDMGIARPPRTMRLTVSGVGGY